MKKINQIRAKRQMRNRAKIAQTSDRAHLTVFRSGKHIYAQLIDQKGKTLATASDAKAKKGTKTEKAQAVGEEIGKKAVELKIKQAVFDRGAYKFHGRVKAVCEGARAAKLVI
ncbi:50S ribosomal protein L18 [Candidatus Beckwithbacteria bacterium]|nr:50S ribosomal protein L18 [Candidatus Beckwithbacteria bacterium]